MQNDFLTLSCSCHNWNSLEQINFALKADFLLLSGEQQPLVCHLTSQTDQLGASWSKRVRYHHCHCRDLVDLLLTWIWVSDKVRFSSAHARHGTHSLAAPSREIMPGSGPIACRGANIVRSQPLWEDENHEHPLEGWQTGSNHFWGRHQTVQQLWLALQWGQSRASQEMERAWRQWEQKGEFEDVLPSAAPLSNQHWPRKCLWRPQDFYLSQKMRCLLMACLRARTDKKVSHLLL